MDSKRLEQFFDEYWQKRLEFSPTYATFCGIHKYNDRVEDLSLKHDGERKRWVNEVYQILKKIPQTDLDATNRVSRKILLEDIELGKRFDPFPIHHLCIDQMMGVHLGFLSVARVHPLKSVDDFQDYVSRLRGHSRQLSQALGHLRRGLKKGWTNPAHINELVIKQLDDFLSKKPAQLPHFQLVEPKLKVLGQQRVEIEKELVQVLKKKILPVLKKLRDFLAGPYRQGCRQGDGICFLPDGKELYRLYVKNHTGLDLEPEQIHELGLREVERIHHEMEDVQREMGFAGTLKEFFQFMRDEESLHYSTREEIVEHHRSLLNRMEKKLPEYFSTLPKNKYEVLPMPEFQEREAPDAYYMPGNSQCGRPGTYYVNTYEPSTRGKFNAEVLAYHEAVPGHHLQISIAQELDHLPEFRKRGTDTAYVEGWALYTEKLAQEMGFYLSPASRFGRLSFEVWRACRLVVDTGIHSMGWSREDAIRFLKESGGLSSENIEVEVDRYIVMPGQALSYKIGELFLLKLRRVIEQKAGDQFDLREFHDIILRNGALHLDILEELVEEYYEAKLAPMRSQGSGIQQSMVGE